MRFLIFAVMFCATLAAGGEIRVVAGFRDDAVPQGTPASYVLRIISPETLSNNELTMAWQKVPTPAGTQKSLQGRSRNRTISGSFSGWIYEYTFAVVAPDVGTYEMPAFVINIYNRNYRIPADSFKVTERKEPLELEMELPRPELYVGEAARVQLNLWAGAAITQLGVTDSRGNRVKPSFEGDAFSSSEFFLEGIDRQSIMRKGEPFRRLRWQVVMTPLKVGTYPLRFSEQVNVSVDDPRLPGFNSSFFRRMTSRWVDLHTPERNITVLPLPEEGKPASFADAIGLFSIEQPTLDRTDLKVGEPVSFSVVIKGQGNFERMGPPKLDGTEGWRQYEVDEEFRPDGNFPDEGTKVFRYALAPESVTVQESPGLVFSFFNPDSKEYVELSFEPQAVMVAPNPAAPAAPAATPGRSASGSLQPLLPVGGLAAQPLTPVFLRPGFLIAQLLILLAGSGLYGCLRWQRRFENDAGFAHRWRQKRHLKAAREAAGEAVLADHPADFYQAAFWCLQHVTSLGNGARADALDGAEIAAFWQGQPLSEEEQAAQREILRTHEAMRFGGFKPSAAALSENLESLNRLLERQTEILGTRGGRKAR